MAEAKAKSKGWPKIGTLRKSDTGVYIKLEEGVEITLNGVKVEMNDKRTVRLENPRDKVVQLYDRGFIDEATKDKRLEKLEEHSWLKYELICPPPK
jgi:hypothetical protein